MPKIGPIHAAINGRETFKGKLYFFRGPWYYRFNWADDKADPRFPLHVKHWNLPGRLAEGPTAALNGEASYEGNAYLFRDKEYARFDWKANSAPAGYPRPLSAWKLPAPFDAGFDAAVNGRGKFKGYALFFKGSKFLLYNWAADAPEGTARSLSEFDLPDTFSLGVDAAIEGEGAYAAYVYFFRGGKYVRCRWDTGKSDPKAAFPVSGNWKKLGEQLEAMPHTAGFYNEWVALAEQLQASTRIPAVFKLAQAALESGWGVRPCDNNLFGVKADPATVPAADRVLCLTFEEFDNPNVQFSKIHKKTKFTRDGKDMWRYDVDQWFRRYDTMLESFEHHSRVLLAPQYAAAFAPPDPLDPLMFATAVAAAGYATGDYRRALLATIPMIQKLKLALD